ncbi:MAG: prephenate dehydratase [Candidatus Pacebacteria bacterium]|nr:prephenate dehydratase [Candidatus Paceibacterota bacterium]
MGELLKKIAFQGQLGAYSDLAARAVFPAVATLPCRVFEDVFAAVTSGQADRGLLPVENSVAGRVAEIHQLLPNAGLYIVGEHFQPVSHCLLAPAGASLTTITEVHSHPQALQQSRQFITKQGYRAVAHVDTAGAAAEIAERNDPTLAAIASRLAGEIYGLQILSEKLEDAAHNTTRFLVLSTQAETPQFDPHHPESTMTSFMFRLRNVPAALYKALGGFATNGVNLTKLESYLVDGKFTAAQFYTECQGHVDSPALKQALDELAFYTHDIKILGSYPAHSFRRA